MSKISIVDSDDLHLKVVLQWIDEKAIENDLIIIKLLVADKIKKLEKRSSSN